MTSTWKLQQSSGWINWTHTFSYYTLDAQLLCNNNGSLLPDDQRSRVRVRADVARADGQIGNFESTNAIHVQVRIDDTAFLARLHRASAELSQRSAKKERTHVSHRIHYRLDQVG
jgi:hypothetical protein